MAVSAHVIHDDAAGSTTGIAGRRRCCRKARGDVEGFHASAGRSNTERAALGDPDEEPVRVLAGIVDLGQRRALSRAGSEG